MTTLSPARIMEVGMAFWPAKVLLSAVELRLFTALGATGMTGAELQAALRLHPRANPDFFDTLVALRFLERDGDGPARALSQHARKPPLFLDRQQPAVHGRLPGDGQRPPVPLLGRPHRRAPDRQRRRTRSSTPAASMFAELYSKPERLEQFMDAMSGISAAISRPLPKSSTSRAISTLCDVGGATGQLSMLVARKHPHLRCIVGWISRRPLRSPSGRSRPRDSPIGSRPSRSTSSREPLPKADVITMGMILHDWNLEKKMHLVRAAYDALPAGRCVRRRREPDR